jgi:hypothetical protein
VKRSGCSRPVNVHIALIKESYAMGPLLNTFDNHHNYRYDGTVHNILAEPHGDERIFATQDLFILK